MLICPTGVFGFYHFFTTHRVQWLCQVAVCKTAERLPEMQRRIVGVPGTLLYDAASLTASRLDSNKQIFNKR